MFEIEGSETIPSGLAEMAPGPELAALLATIDVEELSGYDQVEVLKASQRMASHYAAHTYTAMAAISDTLHSMDDDYQLAHEQAAAEIRVALRLTRRAADTELDLALDLRRRLPGVTALLAAGDLDPRRARTLVHGTSHLSPAGAVEVVGQLLDDAPGLTTGQLAARLRRSCIEADPDEATDRFRKAVTDRRVSSEPTPEGTAHLFGLDLPPHRVAAITRRINRIARSLRRRGDERTMDQIRADIFVDLLQGSATGESGRNRGVVDIHVDLETLTRLNDHAGELAGFGPVIADIARQVTDESRGAEWRFTVTNSDGEVLDNGITRRRPTIGQQREVHAQHPTCVFPGCRMPALDCDLDHRVPHAEGGPTVTTNLAPLCRHDHHIRTKAGWTHTPLSGGRHRWRTRLGQVYITTGPSP
ncbi:MAG: HNH endonuclease [Acidimicrobiia bacterium]|nr:HNH endonuclease [Acidimicrobiia bacterium]NNF10126.1 DUF222 domain-containing protein [Acidimicrobiia bacterium]